MFSNGIPFSAFWGQRNNNFKLKTKQSPTFLHLITWIKPRQFPNPHLASTRAEPVKSSSRPSHQLVNDLNRNQDRFSIRQSADQLRRYRWASPPASCAFPPLAAHVADLYWLWPCCWRTRRTTCGRPLRRCSRTGPGAPPSPSSRYGGFGASGVSRVSGGRLRENRRKTAGKATGGIVFDGFFQIWKADCVSVRLWIAWVCQGWVGCCAVFVCRSRSVFWNFSDCTDKSLFENVDSFCC